MGQNSGTTIGMLPTEPYRNKGRIIGTADGQLTAEQTNSPTEKMEIGRIMAITKTKMELGEIMKVFSFAIQTRTGFYTEHPTLPTSAYPN